MVTDYVTYILCNLIFLIRYLVINYVTIYYIYVCWIGPIIIFVTLITTFVTLVIIYVYFYNTSYTLCVQDIIDKDMTNNNKQDNVIYSNKICYLGNKMNKLL